MKNIFYAILVIVISFALGMGTMWYIEYKSVPEPSELPVALTDTVYQTITNHITDTVQVTRYLTREITKEVVRRDTIIIATEEVQSLFKFNPEPFNVEALCHAQCEVDSVEFTYMPNREYFENLGMKFYLEGSHNYPTWKKWAYFSAGVVGIIAIYKTLGK